MMQSPWDRAQPDEWLPRSLRLCWGGGGDGGGGGGGDSGGGWGGDSGGWGGPSTGGGDWGSSGSYDASSFNAGGDLSAWAGTAYDASTAGTGMGGGGDWGSFGDTSYGGFNAPNPTFADVAGPNPGVTTGGGDWGSAGTFSAAGTGGGPLGAMFGADLGAGAGAPGQLASGGFWGDYAGGGFNQGGGGGFFGNQGGPSGYNTSGPSGYTGGPQGGGPGPFSGGTSRASVTDSTPGYVTSVSGGKDVTPSAPSYGAGIGKGGASDESGKDADDAPAAAPADPDAGGKGADPDAEPDAAPLGTPAPSESEAAPSQPDAAPSGKGIGSDIVASPETRAAPAETEPAAPSTSAFGPQSLNVDYEGSPYADMGPQAAPQQDSTNWGAVFEGANGPYAGPFAGPDVVADRGSQYDTPYPGEQGGGIGVNWGSVFEGANPGAQSFWGDIANQAQSRANDFWSNITDPSPVGGKDPFALGTWFSPTNQPTVSAIYNFLTQGPGGPWGQTQAAMANSQYAGPLAGPDVVGNRGEQNQSPSEPGPYAGPFAGPDVMADGRGTALDDASLDAAAAAAIQNTDYANLANEAGPDWGSVFEGAAPDAQDLATPSIDPTDWGSVFEGAAPAPEALGGKVEAFIPGSQQTNFEYQGSAAPAETAAQSASTAAQQSGASPEAAGAAAAAAYAAAARGASPAEQAEAAAAAAQQAGASQQQAMAIANGVYGQAQEGGGRPQSQGTTLGQVQDAVYGTGGPYITPGGNVYGGHTVADIQAAVYGDSPPGMPTGNPSAPLSEDTSQQSYADTTGRAQSFIPGGQVTNFEYAGSPAQQPQQAPPPSLVEMAQPGINPGAEQYGTQPPAPLGSPPAADIPPGTSGGGIKGVYDAPPWQGATTSDRYLSEVYDRVPNKIDSTGNFTFKDIASGQRLNMEKTQYAVGGLDKDVKTVVEAMGKAMDKAGVPWSITAAYRDNYRQGLITEGFKASPTGSWHGGTARVPTEPGLRGGIKGEPLREGEKNQATKEQIARGGETYGLGRALDVIGARGNSQAVWSWIDQNGSKFGMDRTYKNEGSKDPAHIQPMANFRELAAKIRAGFDPLTGKYQTDDGKPDPNFARKQEAQDRAQREAGRDPNAPRPPADIPPTVLQPPDIPRPPADIPPPPEAPAARPPPDAPLPDARPPADRPLGPNEYDIPVSPARAGRLDIGVVNNALQRAVAHLNEKSGQAEFEAASVVAAKDLARAGVPLATARSALTKFSYDGATKAGYGPTTMGWNLLYKPAIDRGIEAALQGYHPAKPGEVQGPPSPAPAPAAAAPGRQGSLLDFLQNFNPISTAEARSSGRSQPGQLRAPQADPGTIQSRLSEQRSNVINDLQTNQGLRNTLDLIVTGEVGSQGKAAVLGFLETAMNKVAAEASREGRAATGRDLLQYLNDRSYFPDTWGKIESGKIKGGALTDDLLAAIAGGSNTTQLSTGNSSATSQGSRFGGNPTNATIGKEHYGVENYGHHNAWYNAMGALPAGGGIGSDFAAWPSDQGPAVAAQPPQEAPLRGLAKGGHVAKDEPVVVGEEGPEYFVPDQPGTVWPHIPQPGKPGNIDRWPKVPAPEFPGRFGGVEREIRRQTRAAQDAAPGLMDMIDSGRLPLNEANWRRMISDPDLIALGRARMDDRREGIDPGAEQYGVFMPEAGPAAEPPDPASPMAQALGIGSIARPVRIGRQSYQDRR